MNGFVPLILPTTASTLYFLMSFTPLGDTADFVYSQMDNASLIQVSSLFGITGIRILIFWFATLLYDLVESQPLYLNLSSSINTTRHPSFVRHITYFGVVFFLALTFGGLSNVTYGDSFYQTPIEDTIPHKIDVCPL